ncbi:MAG TPA: hypothetical protein VJT32_06910 [bacterium]|nr:hypothetical protein [bacterium]
MVRRSHGRGTAIVRIRLRGIGPIERASGFESAAMVPRLKEMLRVLHEAGQDDLLRAVKHGRVALRDVWTVYRRGHWRRLPTAEHAFPFGTSWEAWLKQRTPAYAKQAGWHRSGLEKVAAPATLGELPGAVRTYRAAMATAAKGAMFNRVLASMSQFLEETVTSVHSLYQEVAAIEKLPERVKRPKYAAKPAEALAIREALGGALGAIWWWMCWHGPIPDEFFSGKCANEDGRCHIRGTKRDSRDRWVPLLFPIPPIAMSQDTFRKRLKASGLGVRPKDARDTFAHLCDLANVPHLWREGLLGHARGSMDYGAIENERVLDEIEERLKALQTREQVGGQMGGQPAERGA